MGDPIAVLDAAMRATEVVDEHLILVAKFNESHCRTLFFDKNDRLTDNAYLFYKMSALTRAGTVIDIYYIVEEAYVSEDIEHDTNFGLTLRVFETSFDDLTEGSIVKKFDGVDWRRFVWLDGTVPKDIVEAVPSLGDLERINSETVFRAKDERFSKSPEDRDFIGTYKYKFVTTEGDDTIEHEDPGIFATGLWDSDPGSGQFLSARPLLFSAMQNGRSNDEGLLPVKLLSVHDEDGNAFPGVHLMLRDPDTHTTLNNELTYVTSKSHVDMSENEKLANVLFLNYRAFNDLDLRRAAEDVVTVELEKEEVEELVEVVVNLLRHWNEFDNVTVELAPGEPVQFPVLTLSATNTPYRDNEDEANAAFKLIRSAAGPELLRGVAGDTESFFVNLFGDGGRTLAGTGVFATTEVEEVPRPIPPLPPVTPPPPSPPPPPPVPEPEIAQLILRIEEMERENRNLIESLEDLEDAVDTKQMELDSAKRKFSILSDEKNLIEEELVSVYKISADKDTEIENLTAIIRQLQTTREAELVATEGATNGLTSLFAVMADPVTRDFNDDSGWISTSARAQDLYADSVIKRNEEISAMVESYTENPVTTINSFTSQFDEHPVTTFQNGDNKFGTSLGKLVKWRVSDIQNINWRDFEKWKESQHLHSIVHTAPFVSFEGDSYDKLRREVNSQSQARKYTLMVGDGTYKDTLDSVRYELMMKVVVSALWEMFDHMRKRRAALPVRILTSMLILAETFDLRAIRRMLKSGPKTSTHSGTVVLFGDGNEELVKHEFSNVAALNVELRGERTSLYVIDFDDTHSTATPNSNFGFSKMANGLSRAVGSILVTVRDFKGVTRETVQHVYNLENTDGFVKLVSQRKTRSIYVESSKTMPTSVMDPSPMVVLKMLAVETGS